MQKLNREQSKRLVEIIFENISEDRRSVRNLAQRTGLSIGAIWNILHGHLILYGNALQICERLSANPYYVLEGKEPKYVDWRHAFTNSNQYSEQDT